MRRSRREGAARTPGPIATEPLARPITIQDLFRSVNVLARVAEVVSGKPFDQLADDTLTGPLAMRDTRYNLPEAHRARVAQLVPLPNGSLPPHQDTSKPTGHFQGNTG